MKLQLLLHSIFILLSLCGTKPITKSNPAPKCGYRPLFAENPRTARIVGGIDALPGNWPWAVSLQKKSWFHYYHHCGGTLINKQWVMSAGHCFKPNDKLKVWKIVIGAHQLSKSEKHIQTRYAAGIYVHESYTRENVKYDIALLKLDKPVEFNNYAQPACLPLDTTPVEPMNDCYIAGWGIKKEEDSKAADILQEARLQQVFVPLCNSTNWYDGKIHEYNLCAGSEQGGVDSCQGDSGGPLMCKRKRDKHYYVAGVTSWGRGCGRKRYPGIYTSTRYFYKWIEDKIASIDGKT
ncbi:acrosin-like [Rhinophrynus dorsalis]